MDFRWAGICKAKNPQRDKQKVKGKKKWSGKRKQTSCPRHPKTFGLKPFNYTALLQITTSTSQWLNWRKTHYWHRVLIHCPYEMCSLFPATQADGRLHCFEVTCEIPDFSIIFRAKEAMRLMNWLFMVLTWKWYSVSWILLPRANYTHPLNHIMFDNVQEQYLTIIFLATKIVYICIFIMQLS